MPERVAELWKYAPVVAILLFAFWAGHKGWWFWGPGIRMAIWQIERERDDWRELALALLKKSGVELPASLTTPPASALASLMGEKPREEK